MRTLDLTALPASLAGEPTVADAEPVLSGYLHLLAAVVNGPCQCGHALDDHVQMAGAPGSPCSPRAGRTCGCQRFSFA